MTQRALLPKHLLPSRYALHLTPDLHNFTFKGSEVIEVSVKKETDVVTLHSLDIKVESVIFTTATKEDIHTTSITYQEKDETVTFTFASPLKVGEGLLRIEYTGNLNNKMVGFYRSKYLVNGEERYMATTQMEPTGARRSFPGWDEPAVKAKFSITLTAPEHLVTLSNMNPIKTIVNNGLKTVTFDDTPIMSTYLVAFVVGEFDYVEGQTKEGIRIRVYTPLGKQDQGEFAKDVAIKCLSYYNDYYGIPYPLPKLDMIAIADFAAGAMENWGLVTYREVALLIDTNNSAVASKQRVAYVVAHELAHQWFGNLVTMEWWKELWLNEGFATFVGNQAVSYMFPEWDIWTQFVVQYVNHAFDLDALENSHPIEVEVYSSAQIEEIFDAISYSKGASVIRMLSNLLGEDNFRKGLNIYLNRHKYGNAVTEDLWNALSESSGFPVGEFMNKYTKTTGYPLVTVESTKETEKYDFSQMRFFSDGRSQPENEAQTWWISLGVSFAGSQHPTRYDFKEKNANLSIPVGGAKWFKVNSNQSGFYRVKYSSDIIANLTTAISSLELPTVDRIGIQNDAFALAKAGLLATTEALNIANAYINEIDFNVWNDLANNLEELMTTWSSEPCFDQLNKFVAHLFTPVVQRLGWDPKPGESASDTLLRSRALNLLGSTGDTGIAAEAKKRFDAHINDKQPINADIRFLVYKTVVATGDLKYYEAVLNIFRTVDLQEEKIRALRALCYNKNPEIIERNLKMSISNEVREQDLYYIFFSLSSFAVGRDRSWEFMKGNWKALMDRVGDTGMLVDRLVKFGTGSFASEEKAQDIEQFFKENPVPAADRTIKQSKELTLARAKWLKSNRESVAKWLTEQKY